MDSYKAQQILFRTVLTFVNEGIGTAANDPHTLVKEFVLWCITNEPLDMKELVELWDPQYTVTPKE